MSVVDRVARVGRRVVRSQRFEQWDHDGGPGRLLRRSMDHPVVVTVTTAVVLAVVLGATFGVPPFTPLVLVVLVVAPIVPWLRMQRRFHAEWLERRAGEGDEGDPHGG